MEHVHTVSLLIITLLQLCQAELPGSWYSANVINEGAFSPKPISEIFSTEPTFSSTNPIVVVPSSTPSTNEAVSYSTQTTGLGGYSSTETTPQQFVSSSPASPPSSTFANYVTQTTQQSIPDPGQIEQQTPFPFQVNQPGNPNLPNYFLIYQQAPQTVQNFPPTASQAFPVTASQQTFSTAAPQQSTFQPDLSSFQPSSTISPEVSSFQPTFSTFQPSSQSTFPSNLPNSPEFPSTTPSSIGSTIAPCNNPTNRPSSQSVTPATTGLPRFPALRIRMVAPSGSITNINVNQPSQPTTTRRPTTRRTTTRRTTTTRTRKLRKNTYDGCTNACDGRRTPICASPLSVAPINPDTLKGFPSVCHMACHNSFKKIKYEMLVEGRCGRLRTRIQPVDATGKLKRDELNRNQYTIIDNPETVLEFQSLPR